MNILLQGEYLVFSRICKLIHLSDFLKVAVYPEVWVIYPGLGILVMAAAMLLINNLNVLFELMWKSEDIPFGDKWVFQGFANFLIHRKVERILDLISFKKKNTLEQGFWIFDCKSLSIDNSD